MAAMLSASGLTIARMRLVIFLPPSFLLKTLVLFAERTLSTLRVVRAGAGQRTARRLQEGRPRDRTFNRHPLLKKLGKKPLYSHDAAEVSSKRFVKISRFLDFDKASKHL